MAGRGEEGMGRRVGKLGKGREERAVWASFALGTTGMPMKHPSEPRVWEQVREQEPAQLPVHLCGQGTDLYATLNFKHPNLNRDRCPGVYTWPGAQLWGTALPFNRAGP